MKLLSDGRWKGYHGIGRFAQEVLARLPQHLQLENGPRPLSPIDSLWLSYQAASKKPSVFFSPAFNPPLFCSAPLVFTIHDPSQVELNGGATQNKRLYYKLVVKPAAHRAHRLLTVSEFTRRRILEWSGLAESRVVVVGNGVGPRFCPHGEKYEPGYPYVLYVGNSRAHKNLGRLLDAFEQVDFPQLRLLLTCSPTYDLRPRLMRSKLAGRVVFLGAVGEGELARLYRGAQLLALPSLSEGFGLPALEAMACGTPVVASRDSATAEVLNGAGVLVDPFETLSIRDGIEKLLVDPDRRRLLSEHGLRRAGDFCWDRVANSVRSVLEEASGTGL